MDSVAMAWHGLSEQHLHVDGNGQPDLVLAPTTAADPIPHFSYIERFEDGSVYAGISCGGGRFVDASEEESCRSPHVSFTVEKDRTEKTISIDIRSSSLSATIFRALVNCNSSVSQISTDFETLMKDYESLKAHLLVVEANDASLFTTRELRLLVEDLLLERGLFEGIGTEDFRQRNILCRTHVNDMHQRSVDAGFDEVDDCFALGLVGDSVTEEKSKALYEKYLELLGSGNFLGLHTLSEPLLRAGQMGSQQNLTLLSRVFDQGHSDISRQQDIVTQAIDNRLDSNFGVPQTLRNLLPGAVAGEDTELTQALLQEGEALEGNACALDEGSLSLGQYSVDYNDLFRGCNWPKVDDGRRDMGLAFAKDEVQNGGGLSAAQRRDDATILADLPLLHPDEQFSNQEGHFVSLQGGSREEAVDVSLEATRSKRTQSHIQRQKLGRGIIACLNTLCRAIRETCAKTENIRCDPALFPQYATATPAKVWERGSATFRQIIYNRPPRGLVQVLDCLLVTAAICATLPVNHGWMHQQFLNDLTRWRSLLDAEDQPRFDEIAFSLWSYTYTRDPVIKNDERGDIVLFEDLIQHLVITEDEGRQQRLPRQPLPFPFASRLQTIHRDQVAESGHLENAHAGPVAIPITRDSDRKRTWDDSFEMSPGSSGAAFSIEEFFDVESFLSQSVDTEAPEEEHDDGLFLKDISRSTMDVLSSVAFAIVFTFITGLQLGFDNPTLIEPWNRAHGYKRSCNILNTFLNAFGIQEGSPKQSNTVLGLRGPASPTEYLSLSTLSMNSDRYPRFPPPSTSVPVRSSRPRLGPDSHPHAASPLSPPTADCLRDTRRLSCPQCQRSFSSMGNRNKHMREGCALREKSGYRCRNAPCIKVLTTKWYRNTHEQERCRYRGAQPRAGLASST